MALVSDNFLFHSILMLCVANGGMMSFAPEVAAKTYGFEVERGTAARLFVEGSGYITLCSAVALYLGYSEKFPLELTLGCGMLPRIFWLAKAIVRGEFAAAGVRADRIRLVATAVSACTYVLLSGKGDADVAAKVIISLVGVAGTLLFLAPGLASSIVFGKDVSKPGKDLAVARGVFKSFGKANLVNVSSVTALAMGASPVKALGWSCAVWALAELHDLVTKHHLDLGKGMWMGVVTLSILAATSSMLLA